MCLSVTSNGGACDGSTVVRRRIPLINDPPDSAVGFATASVNARAELNCNMEVVLVPVCRSLTFCPVLHCVLLVPAAVAAASAALFVILILGVDPGDVAVSDLRTSIIESR